MRLDSQNNTSGGDNISVGNITNSEVIAIGRNAVAIKASGDVIFYEGTSYPRPDYRSDIEDLVTFYTKRFVGREKDWLHIVQFATQETPGYLLVEALPGYGKTALMTQMIHRYETDQWDNAASPYLVYFFIHQ